jgi:hypothetical protein
MPFRLSAIPWTTVGLKHAASATNLNSCTSLDENWNSPLPSVLVTAAGTLSGILNKLTFAPAITAPEASTTVPVMLVFGGSAGDWPNATPNAAIIMIMTGLVAAFIQAHDSAGIETQQSKEAASNYIQARLSDDGPNETVFFSGFRQYFWGADH